VLAMNQSAILPVTNSIRYNKKASYYVNSNPKRFKK